MVKNFLDISETNNKVLQAIHTWVKSANYNAKLELDSIFEEVDDLIEKTGLTDFDIFRQRMSNTDSRKTGELVFRWTQSYFDWKSNVDYRRSKAIKNANPISPSATIRDANMAYIEELRDNVTVFDPRILFYDEELFDGPAPTEKQKEDHIKELKDLLGERGYEQYLELNERKMEEYKLERASTLSLISAEVGEERSEFSVGAGCKACVYSGYLGRMGIFEMLVMSDELRQLLLNGASADQVKAQALKGGMVNIAKDGMLKAKAGKTTPTEVLHNSYSVG